MARYDDLNTGIIAYSTVISCLLLLAIILGVYALAMGMSSIQHDIKQNAYEYTSAEDVQREQLASINGSIRWVTDPAPEPAEGEEPVEPVTRLEVPIDRAIQITLEKLSSPKSRDKNQTEA